MVRRWTGVLVVLTALLAPWAGRAQDADKSKQLQEQRAQIQERIGEAEKILAQNPPAEQKAKLEEQVGKWRARLKQIDTELAGAKQPEAKELDEESKKEIARLEREIKALVIRVQARAEAIAKTPKDEPLPQPVGVPGGEPSAPADPGMVAAAPGFEAPPEGGAPMMGMEGQPVPTQPVTRRQKLEQEQQQDLNKLAELRAKVEELKFGPKDVALPDEDNLPEMNPLVLYGGTIEKNAYGAKLGNWGSGNASEADQGIVEGLKSILLYTDGYYRGMKLDFAQPPAIKTYFEKPEISYLQLDIVFFPKVQAAQPGSGSSEGMPGSEMMPAEPGMEGAPAMTSENAPPAEVGFVEGGVPPGADPGMAGAPPMEPGSGMPMEPGSGAPGDPGMGAPTPAPTTPQIQGEPATRSLRVVLDTDRGPIVAEDQYFDHTYAVNPGWTRVFIPVKEFVLANERLPESLSRLRLFGDTKDAFYIGMIRLVADEAPIKPTILGKDTVQAVAGEEVKLEGVVSAGLSALTYAWDWGDGDTEETEEPKGSHLYVKAGEYTVTFIARDKDKLKEDGQTTVKVVVKPFAEVPKAPGGGGRPVMPGGA